jgi:dimethylaniline monooxygenase (N-oxide forming)
MTFELIGYADSLLKNLGLNSHRKGLSKDYFVPCKASDFVGLKDEYIRKYGCDAVRE